MFFGLFSSKEKVFLCLCLCYNEENIPGPFVLAIRGMMNMV